MLLKYKHLLFLLLIPCLFLASCNKDDDNNDEMEMEEEMEAEVTYDYISFTFDGTEYSGLKSLFADTAPFYSNITDIAYSSDEDEYVLQLSAYHNDIQIDFDIHQNLWQAGTYNISEGNYSWFDSTDILGGIFITDTGEFRSEVTSGSLTITEFNTEDRVITATFSFSYVLDDWTGNIEGPFEITNGTINVPLDDDYFD